ncbi:MULTISPECIES: hypothetical protein [Streptomyces]|uniref:hypothetical protein n=1 Tax=Streptomyces TaxID=1883 RepID=UPI00345BF874
MAAPYTAATQHKEYTVNPGNTRQDLGLGHQEHPLIGRLVLDSVTGRMGILRAVAPEDNGHGQWTVRGWLAPPAGGREWTAPVDRITEAKQ